MKRVICGLLSIIFVMFFYSSAMFNFDSHGSKYGTNKSQHSWSYFLRSLQGYVPNRPSWFSLSGANDLYKKMMQYVSSFTPTTNDLQGNTVNDSKLAVKQCNAKAKALREKFVTIEDFSRYTNTDFSQWKKEVDSLKQCIDDLSFDAPGKKLLHDSYLEIFSLFNQKLLEEIKRLIEQSDGAIDDVTFQKYADLLSLDHKRALEEFRNNVKNNELHNLLDAFAEGFKKTNAKDLTKESIKKAALVIAAPLHPDKNIGNEENAKKQFVNINQQRDTLIKRFNISRDREVLQSYFGSAGFKGKITNSVNGKISHTLSNQGQQELKLLEQ